MSSIVWLASYPKSGNTWVRAFLQNYINDSHKPADINALDEYFADESKPYWYSPYTDRTLEELTLADICQMRESAHLDIADSRRGTIIVKTHNLLGEYDDHPLHNMSVTAGAVYVVRSPLDVVLSISDHFGISIDESIVFVNEEGTATPTDEANVASVISSWSNHVTTWTHDQGENLRIVRYEDLLAKPGKTFAGIASFLGLGKDPGRLKRAIRHSSFDALKKQETKSGFVERSPNSKRFFRAGRQNQWRTMLTPKQVEAVVEANREQMKRFKYLPKGF
jgi:hypothetical protein